MRHDSAVREFMICITARRAAAYQAARLAHEIGRRIAERGWTLVSGGGNGNRRSHGAVALSARSRVRTVSVIPGALVIGNSSDVDADELIVTDTMRQRKP